MRPRRDTHTRGGRLKSEIAVRLEPNGAGRGIARHGGQTRVDPHGNYLWEMVGDLSGNRKMTLPSVFKRQKGQKEDRTQTPNGSVLSTS